MLLPGRLRTTTLGDLLGLLHRASSSGTLELVEANGRVHRIHVAMGLVVAVEIDGAAASLAEVLRDDKLVDDDTLRRSLLRAMASRRLHGEVLSSEFRLAPSIVEAALRRQLIVRLRALERLHDAQICFRVALRAPRGALFDRPLSPAEFLAGRRRTRERTSETPDVPRAMPRPSPPPIDARKIAASRALGIELGADLGEVKRAYRRLARDVHPDLHPRASMSERRTLEARFAAITAAYQTLVA